MEIIKAFTTNSLSTEITIKGTIDTPLFRASDIGLVLDILSIRSTVRDFDETEKITQVIYTPGGEQSIIFLTEKGLYHVLFRSRKPIAKIFQSWVLDVVAEIRKTGRYQLDQQLVEKEQIIQATRQLLEEKENTIQSTQQLLEEKENTIQETQHIVEEKELQNRLLESTMDNLANEKIPSIYIYNTDTTREPKQLKIGYTLNVHARIKPYKQTHPHGKLEFTVQVSNCNVRTIENYIHNVFTPFRINGEMFELTVEEAKIHILHVVNSLTISQITNNSERILKLKQIYEFEQSILENSFERKKITTHEISTQTDFDEMNPVVTQPIIHGNQELLQKFDTFIENHCIVRSDVEVSAKEIIGLYRLNAREAKKEITQAFTDYLKRKYKYDRLKIQDKDEVVMGYIGVMLKPLQYNKQLVRTDEETFVFERCVFSPSGTALHKSIVEEYKDWKRTMKIPFVEEDEPKLKKYLKSSPYLLFETVWSAQGGGQGYYGLCLKSDVRHHRISSTGCRIEKCDMENRVLSSYLTIAKAAEEETMCAAKMSRAIKDKRIFSGSGGDYYFRK